jgi:hypothetical protein
MLVCWILADLYALARTAAFAKVCAAVKCALDCALALQTLRYAVGPGAPPPPTTAAAESDDRGGGGGGGTWWPFRPRLKRSKRSYAALDDEDDDAEVASSPTAAPPAGTSPLDLRLVAEDHPV